MVVGKEKMKMENNSQLEKSDMTSSTSAFPLCLGQVLDLQRDVGVLRQDLEAANTKLASSMNSIKTFWSPELKKERSMRRDELQVQSTENDYN